MKKELKLVKLEDVDRIKNKKLIVLGGNTKHLDEISENDPNYFRYINWIISINTNRPKEIRYKGVSIPVVGIEDFAVIIRENPQEYVYLILDDYHRELYDEIIKIPEVTDSVKEIYWYPDRETRIELTYRKRYSKSPLENIIVFRSGPHAANYVHGMDYTDNSRVLFEYLLENEFNERYELVWVVKEPKGYISRFDNRNNIHFISWEWSTSENITNRDEYYRVLCTAKYFFFTDAYGFVRNCRADQKRIQLWHGFGFKTRTNFVSCGKRYDYHTCISKFYGDIHAKDFGLRKEQILLTGQPKNDLLYKKYESNFLDELGIPNAKKYILWLPTFRKATGSLSGELDETLLETETGFQIINTFEKLQKLEKFLEEKEISLVIKLHPFQDLTYLERISSKRICLFTNEEMIQKDIQVNEMMPYFDALISDYSSAAVDYLLLNRPIAFTLDDLNEYTNGRRGFHFDNLQSYLPGNEIYNEIDFLNYIEEVAEEKDVWKEKRERIRMLMQEFYDGNSCKRIVEALKLKK